MQSSYLVLILLCIYFGITSSRIFNGFEIRDLVGSPADFSIEAARWQVSPSISSKIINCGADFIGTTLKTDNFVFRRYYDQLAPHTMIYFSINVVLIDGWANGDKLRVEFDSISLSFDNTGSLSGNTSICGSSNNDLNDFRIYGKVAHSASNITLKLSNPASKSNFGFRNINLLLTSDTASTSQICVNSAYLSSQLVTLNGQCACDSGKYYINSSFGCVSCNSLCDACFGGSAANCYKCSNNGNNYFDGTACVACDPKCSVCHGTTDTQCDRCVAPYFLLNHTCIPCNSPLIQSVASDNRYCIFPCQEHEFLYPDGQCFSTCDYPLQTTINSFGKFCSSPCSSGSTIYYNNTCAPTCNYPFKLSQHGSYQICEYVCPSGSYLYQNNTCAPTCDYPYQNKTIDGFNVCQPFCTNLKHYRYWNDTCINSCEPLLQSSEIGGLRVCKPPKCGIKLCDLCPSIGGGCQEYFYCNAVYGNYCVPLYEYKLEVKVVKTILNGVVLKAEVVPLKGLAGGTSDELDFLIQGLEKGVGYTSDQKKLGIGSFEITLNILNQVNTTTPIINFVYSPSNWGLKAELKLPRLTFLSSTVQSSANTFSKGSQIAFLIFLVSMSGVIMGGGLASLWSSLPESQYIYYLIYLNLDFLHHTEVYFESLGNYDLLMSSNDDNNLDAYSADLRNSLPKRFVVKSYSPDFIDNCGQLYIQLLITTSALVISLLLTKYIRFSGRGLIIFKLLEFIKKTFRWNGLLRQMMTYILPLTTAACIQIYSGIFGKSVSFRSLLASLGALMFVFFFFNRMFSLISEIPKSRYEKTIYSKFYGTLWTDLNLHSNSKYYYWFVTLRSCTLAYVSVFFALFPYAQIIILIIYQCGIISLFIRWGRIHVVFEDPLLNKVTLIEELLLLFVKLAMLAFYALKNSVTDNTLILVGWIIILPALLIQVIQTVYTFYAQIRDRKKLCNILAKLTYKLGRKKITKIRRQNNREKIVITKADEEFNRNWDMSIEQ